MSDDESSVEVRIACAEWDRIDCEGLALDCFGAVRARSPAVKRPVCVLFTDDNEVRKLNADYRGKDRPTNVLAFTAGDGLSPEHDYLGDIAIAFETCRGEAAERRISLRDHAAHLLIHGMLHLMGYDHDSDETATAMERREAEILAVLGVPDPYAALLERKA